jgi:hypothetical protein
VEPLSSTAAKKVVNLVISILNGVQTMMYIIQQIVIPVLQLVKIKVELFVQLMLYLVQVYNVVLKVIVQDHLANHVIQIHLLIWEIVPKIRLFNLHNKKYFD